MKRYLVVGLVILVVGALVTIFALPILAHEPADEDASVNQETWEAMHEACEEGDWEAMTEAAEEAHGANLDNMPCHDGDDAHAGSWSDMGSHMGSGMMGGMY